MYYKTPVLESERLILKRGDVPDYRKVYEYDFRKLRDINGVFEFVKLPVGSVDYFADDEEDIYDWIVYLKDGMIPIANITADRERSDISSIEIAFNTHPSFWRMGYSMEYIICVLKFLFSSGYKNVVCGYDEGNIKSKSIGEKLGFLPFEVVENAWYCDGVGINSYSTIMSLERFNELYK